MKSDYALSALGLFWAVRTRNAWESHKSPVWHQFRFPEYCLSPRSGCQHKTWAASPRIKNQKCNRACEACERAAQP